MGCPHHPACLLKSQHQHHQSNRQASISHSTPKQRQFPLIPELSSDCGARPESSRLNRESQGGSPNTAGNGTRLVAVVGKHGLCSEKYEHHLNARTYEESSKGPAPQHDHQSRDTSDAQTQ